MSINIGPASSDDLRPKIMVIGVGGAGGNAIANMMEAGIEGVDFIVVRENIEDLYAGVGINLIFAEAGDAQRGPEAAPGRFVRRIGLSELQSEFGGVGVLLLGTRDPLRAPSVVDPG